MPTNLAYQSAKQVVGVGCGNIVVVSLARNVAVPAVGVAKRRNNEVVRAVVDNRGRQACNVVSVSSRGDEGTVQACGGLASATEGVVGVCGLRVALADGSEPVKGYNNFPSLKSFRDMYASHFISKITFDFSILFNSSVAS